LPASFNDPNHWEWRAEDARRLAQQITQERIKERMLRIANDYQKLAARALESSGEIPKPKNGSGPEARDTSPAAPTETGLAFTRDPVRIP
jgi:hypothetical protein